MPHTEVFDSTSDGKITSLPLMTRSLILGLIERLVAKDPGSQYERGSLYRLLFWYDYAPEGVCMHQGCSSDAGDFKRYVSCLVPARQRLENVERTFAPVEAQSHARRWGTRR